MGALREIAGIRLKSKVSVKTAAICGFAIWRILALVMDRSQPHSLNPPLLKKERGRKYVREANAPI
jgi:hypothetical protein